MDSLRIKNLNMPLTPGQVYRREDFKKWSSSVDRHLKALVVEGKVRKLQHGLYLCPKVSEFGETFPDENSVLGSFLKDDHFVVYSPSMFNSLELGLTQLYNERVVFNRKRHGEFELGGRKYTFYRWREAPKQLSKEFLLVELLNRLPELAENRDDLEARLKQKMSSFNSRRLKFALMHYGTKSAQLRYKKLMEPDKRVA